MESYINILKKVNRLDLEDLLDYIYDKSYDIMNLLLRESKFSLHKLNVKPWELEVLATLVLLKKSFDKKYYHLSIRDKEGDKILKSILYSIKSYEDEIIEERKLIDERFNKLFTLMLNSQLSYQLDSRIFLFRNKYLFNFNDVDFEENHINIKKSFEEKIGINYNDFENLIVNAQWIIVVKKDEGKELFHKFYKENKQYLKFNTSEIKKFQDLQRDYYKKINYEYYFGFKYLSVYPIIDFGCEEKLVLPHLFITSLSQRLINRFTYKDEKMRVQMGKVIEKYLYYLCNISCQFTKISQEIPYKKNNLECKSSDVICSVKGNLIFIESKLYVPNNAFKHLDSNDEETCDRIAEGIIQIHNKIMDYTNDLYCFEKKVEKNNIFGILILNEDNLISREYIYELVSKKLEVSIESEVYKYICSNIKITDLFSFETALLFKISILDNLTTNKDNESHWFNYSIFSRDNNEVNSDNDMIEEFSSFLDNHIYNCDLAREFIKDNYFSPQT